MKKHIIVLSLSLVFSNSACSLSGTETESGLVTGIKAKNGVEMFLGIPYAKPPIGDLRWKSPQPVDPWKTPLVADKYGAPCPQVRGGKIDPKGNEDCLTLNVWKPKGASSDSQLPVMVWIHPGSFSINSGATWGGKNLSDIGNVVVVSLNYRLNIFGFLALEGLKKESKDGITGNYGFEDQQLALQWVQKNIANFGGDPENVTIFGESSGGMAVCAHMISSKSKGLFHKAIAESGPCATLSKKMDTSVKEGTERVAPLGCNDSEDVLACLRKKPTLDLVKALPVEANLSGVTWSPVIDNVILTDSPSNLFKLGKVGKEIPVLFLVTKDEGMLMVNGVGKMDIDEKQYSDIITNLAKSKDNVDKILAQYSASKYPTPAHALGDFLTDRDVKCVERRDIQAISKAGANAYMSYFTSGRDIDGMKKLGAFHTVEIDFVFFSDQGSYGLTDAEKVLARSMMSYWSSFAHTGNPNATATGVSWPKVSDNKYIVFNTNKIEVVPNMFPECDFWDQIVRLSNKQ